MSVQANNQKTRWRRTPLTDVIVGVIVALLSGYLFSPVVQGQGASGLDTQSTPFETHSNMLLVNMTINRNSAPIITKVEKLASGRITVIPQGDNTLELLDSSAKAIYQQSFQVSFLQPGEPPKSAESVTLVLVVPYTDAIATVRVTTPKGSNEVQVEK